MKRFKNILMLVLVLAMSISMIACAPKEASKEAAAKQETQKEEHKQESSSEEVAKEIKIESHGKTTMVPMNPKKVAILELSAIDTIDALGEGDSIVGMPKATKVKHLDKFFNNDKIANLGSLKEVDMELLHSLKPDLIILGGRQLKHYDDYAAIAPTIIASTDNKIGYIKSFHDNVLKLAQIYGKEDKANELMADFDKRIKTLNEVSKDKTTLVVIATKNNLNVLGPKSRGSMISNEIGFTNLAKVESSHGDNVSFEFIVEKNPDYIFVLDRDAAINAKGSKTAKELMDNELLVNIDAYKNGNIVYLTPDVWYLAEGGVASTDIMLKDLETGILK